MFTERAGPACIWCVACFKCDVCEEPLVDLHYFYKDGELFCGRHHAELLKPRCAACDEVCSLFLEFIQRNTEKLTYFIVLQELCSLTTFSQLILAKEYTLAEEKNWHIDHFCCWECDSPLGGQRYVTRDDHPFCILCYEELFARKFYRRKRIKLTIISTRKTLPNRIVIFGGTALPQNVKKVLLCECSKLI